MADAVALAPARAEALRWTERYYTARAVQFGATPTGVDWTCVATQQMRFVQLLRICPPGPDFALNDLGCGYGALLDFLHEQRPDLVGFYAGVDLSEPMIRLARERHPGHADRFAVGARPTAPADVTVLSGPFNVRSEQSLAAWEAAVESVLDDAVAASRHGLAVNFLHRDRIGSAAGLYATLPDRWIAHCRARFGAAVETVDGYGLPEFTLLVRPADAATPNRAWARTSSGR